ncbi:MAG: hypothetical protein ACRDSZ_02185 [Pseudonocardiaceae bacterium]
MRTQTRYPYVGIGVLATSSLAPGRHQVVDHLQELIRQHHEEVARALREKSEEHADVDDYQEQGDLARREVPLDPMRRRTFVTWGLATTTGAVGAADVGRIQL